MEDINTDNYSLPGVLKFIADKFNELAMSQRCSLLDSTWNAFVGHRKERISSDRLRISKRKKKLSLLFCDHLVFGTAVRGSCWVVSSF